jgi:Glycosyl transferase family 90
LKPLTVCALAGLSLPNWLTRDVDVDPASEVGQDLRELAAAQLEPWSAAALDRGVLKERFAYLNAIYLNVYLFDIIRNRVAIRAKPDIKIPRDLAPIYRQPRRAYLSRARCYLALIRRLLNRGFSDINTTIAIDVDDIGLNCEDVPLLSFQKKSGEKKILLPDVDFFYWNWYSGEKDPHRYDDKVIRASFVGSSTGGVISETTLGTLDNDRLRAASYFVDKPHVDFRIARAAQCDSTRTKAMLESQRYFRPAAGWSEQRKNRFLISMDGNGACCSRLAIALKSNSVLVKYKSPYELFYFGKMIAGRDYVSVGDSQEIERIVEREMDRPGHFRCIAEYGTRFYNRFLTKESVLAYAGQIISFYSQIVDQPC